MAKRRTDLTEKRIQQLEKEGRGQGEGTKYKPWITIQDFPSNGLVTRAAGWKTHRIHHFLSKLERDYFYTCEWDNAIIDIREQYPLHRIDTMNIAEEKNVKHPTDPTTGVPIVMTTDFLLTVKTAGSTKLLARTIKPSAQLENDRIIEKFEIEREYWSNHGVDWGIVTEKEIPSILVNNIEWLHSSFFLHEQISNSAYQSLSQHLKYSLLTKGVSLIEIFSEFDMRYGLEDGMGLELFKHLVAVKEVIVDMNKPIHTHLFVDDIIIGIGKELVKGVV
ncbi:TnsA endonuclease N-terminal domain-containing protein [Brevibacillus sp. NRS-1366]|uniref:TnsA endonuclease N-terminal domain-containing protein n=1 Tax=Brevibacillus sp. NRS-1366 TaxID=3233899 RepID=UPI003D1C2D9F